MDRKPDSAISSSTESSIRMKFFMKIVTCGCYQDLSPKKRAQKCSKSLTNLTTTNPCLPWVLCCMANFPHNAVGPVANPVHQWAFQNLDSQSIMSFRHNWSLDLHQKYKESQSTQNLALTTTQEDPTHRASIWDAGHWPLVCLYPSTHTFLLR